jgi:hypothetical protein
VHASTAIVEALSALERAAGILDALGRSEDAHRCTMAAANLQATFVDELEISDEALPQDAED